MPIPFTCPHCGEQTLAEERYAGHEGPCVNCGRTVTIPSDAPRTAVSGRSSAAEQTTQRWMKTVLVSIGAIALLASVIAMASLLLGPALQAGRTISLRHRCAGNLKQIALALDAYERDYGNYPPAYTLGPDGKPWHSWRVLVLPYLGVEAGEVYKRYDMSQPWDSQHNMQLLTSMPDVFASPADDVAKTQYETSYLAVVGPGMIFAGAAPTTSSQIGDGRNATILLLEVRGAAIAWTEPRDLDGRAMGYRIGTDLGGNHAGGVNVATADGETHFLPDSLAPEEVHALLTRAGGEDIGLDGE